MQKANAEIMPRIHEYWTDAAEVYSELVQKELSTGLDKIWLSKILKNAPQKERLDVLDIGTGPGFFPIIMAGAGHMVEAVDCTEQMLTEARNNARVARISVGFHLMDSHHLTFADESFDLILSRNVTWTLYDPAKAYSEWKRVLRPGGRFIVFDANYGMYCFDKKIAGQRARDAKRYEEKYGEPAHPNRSEYIEKMYLSDKKRPDWDKNILRELDMDVYCEENISDEVGTERSRLAGATTPMFMVVATKQFDFLSRGTF